MKDVAIIGMAVDLPKVKTLNQFWEIITQERDLVDVFPAKRKNSTVRYIRYRRGRMHHRFEADRTSFHNGCFLEDPEMFDYRFFNMTPKQAQTMDPHQRLILKTFYRALDDAGYANAARRPKDTGVFVGFASNPGNDYISYVSEVDPTLGQVALTGNVPCMLANRLSHFLDIYGPSMIIDSACSASLVATLTAVRSVQSGECRMALIGGARLCTPISEANSRIGIESSDGRTRTFDAKADGTGLGEGSGAIVVKLLENAIADNDHIYAVIKGGAINHDGQTDGITTPDAASQARLLQQAWKNSGINPAHISYIEAHGTATRIGDPIEVDGMKQAFANQEVFEKQCAIGTVKTNIGHLFEASGVLGVIKVSLMLQHRTLVRNANLKMENLQLGLADSPLYLNQKARPWEPIKNRLIAGVSAFGLGGSNCHLVLEDAPNDSTGPEPVPQANQYLFVLSAHTRKAFSSLVTAMIRHFDEHDYSERMAELCSTQLLGKNHHPWRAGLVVRDFSTLKEQLRKLKPIQTEEAAAKPEIESETVEEKFLAQFLADRNYTEYPPYRNKSYKRVPTPSAPFEEQDCQLLLPEHVEILPHDFERDGLVTFRTTYIEHPIDSINLPQPGASYLIFDADGSPKTKEMVRILQATGSQVVVASPDVLEVDREDDVRLGDIEDDYSQLVETIKGQGISTIIHLSSAAEKNNVSTSDGERKLTSLFKLSKALMKASYRCRFIVVTEQARFVEGHDKATEVRPVHNALIGFAAVIPRETPFIQVRCLDVQEQTPARSIVFELGADSSDRLVLYRNQKRFVETFEYEDVISSKFSDVDFEDEGVYLITGGTGELGLALAEYIATKCRAHIVLTSRSGMLDRKDWNEVDPADRKLHNRVQKLLRIESLGSTVEVLSADSASERDVRFVMDHLGQNYGKLDGLFHAAGVPGTSLIANKSMKQFEEVVGPKVKGLQLMEPYFQKLNLRFAVFFSSVACVFPTAGQSDYAAANSFMDSFAGKHNGAIRMVSMQWCAWKEIGMAVDYNTNQDVTFKAIPTRQGLDCLYSAIRHVPPVIFVGEIHYTSEIIHILKDLGIRMSAEILEKIEFRMQAHRGAHKSRESGDNVKSQVQCQLRGRDDGNYTDAERAVGNAWANALGYSEIDINDDFFELGGESITAISIVTHINENTDFKIDVATMLEKSTIAKIAASLQGEPETVGSNA